MNKTLYIKPEDAPTWEKAKRYLRFYANQSLADIITPHLEGIVAGFEADESAHAELEARRNEAKRTKE